MMKNRIFIFIILLIFQVYELSASNSFQEEQDVYHKNNTVKSLYHYENFHTIQSISAVLDKARERKKALGCNASEILVCLDVDLFSVRTNGGSDPLEECTVDVYQALLQEGFKVLRLTARGYGIYVPNESRAASHLRRLNNDLVKALRDTSVGFSCDDFRMNLDFPSDGLKQAFTQYGYYLQGTLFAGPYKAYMLGGFLQAIQYLPEVIIMGDDDLGYLLGFLQHGTLKERVGGELHLLHMAVETHIKLENDTFVDVFIDSLETSPPDSFLLEIDQDSEYEEDDIFFPDSAYDSHEQEEDSYSCLAAVLNFIGRFVEYLYNLRG